MTITDWIIKVFIVKICIYSISLFLKHICAKQEIISHLYYKCEIQFCKNKSFDLNLNQQITKVCKQCNLYTFQYPRMSEPINLEYFLFIFKICFLN